MRVVTISSKNQITIPKDFLLSLNLHPRGRIIIQKDNGALLMKPMRHSIVSQTAGSLTKYVSTAKLKAPFTKILRETKRKTAAQLAKKL